MCVIALLTDFGLSDVYVGVMKGVILGIHPTAQIIDITHDIQAQNVRLAALALRDSARYFAAGTIFVVVVDPGVGGERRPIAAQSGDYVFVAPDNGVLSYAIEDLAAATLVELTSTQHRLEPVSYTFHGRDIFAPAAAHLAAGVPIDQLGPRAADPVVLPQPTLTVAAGRLVGEVVQIDHFGNIVTSIGPLRWTKPDEAIYLRIGSEHGLGVPISATDAQITIDGQTINGIIRAYGAVARGTLLATIGSSGYLEVAINQGGAAARLDAAIGDMVELYTGVN
ncbi:MAG: SAM-dependent chlorinase/fluorinase [Chloroflexi bacterium]|nr:SAM-dependent chlorinase/fluorinase [Chloroflexota bacterium]